jgi:hypothetical protein
LGKIIIIMISTTENSNNFFKIRFWKEKSIEDKVTMGKPY